MVPAPGELVGWAAVAGRGRETTTGGDGGETVRPATVAELLAYGVSPDPLVIELDGTFEAPRLELLSNKTLVGVAGGATINGGIRIRPESSGETVENVIVRNLRVNGTNSAVEGDAGEASNDDDDAIVIYRAHHVWIDHVEVWDGRDGNLDIVHGSDFVTVSWSKFRYSEAAPYEDHRYSNLVGHSDSATAAEEDRGALSVTFHHNWWAERVVERMPRVRFGKVHVFDNYYSSAGNNYCIRAGFESDVLVENNVFDGVGKPHEINEDDGGPGKLTARGNEYATTTGAKDATGTAFDPPYAYAPDPAAAVKALVTEGAGPR
jgi:pectate lyase